jgi:hypothetical protein
MTRSQDPRQALLILDVQQTLALEDIRGRLPEPAEGETSSLQEFRLLTRLSPPWPTDGQPSRPLWQAWARQVEDLVRELRSFARQQPTGEVQLYVAGDAPLPLFVQLGRLLADWPWPISFFDVAELSRAQKKWNEVHIPPRSDDESARRRATSTFFDQRDLRPPTQSETSPLPIPFLVSNRGMSMDRGGLTQLGSAQPSGIRYWLELGTTSFKPLSSSNVQQAERELSTCFQDYSSRSSAELTPELVLHGTPLLAFVAGRALPNQSLSVPYFANHRYVPGLPLPLPQPQPVDAKENIRICLIYEPARRGERKLDESLEIQLRGSISPKTPFQLQIVDLYDLEIGQDRYSQRKHRIESSDLVVVFQSPELNVGELANFLPMAHRHPGFFPVQERPGGALAFEPEPERLAGYHQPIQGFGAARVSFPRDGQAIRGHRTHIDKLLAELANEILKRAQAISDSKQSNQSRNLPYLDATVTYQTWQQASSVEEYLSSITNQLPTIPRLQCTKHERYNVWYGLVLLIDRLKPAENINDQLRALSAADQAGIRQHQPDLKANLTHPDDPLGLVLHHLTKKEAVQWLYLGIVEVSPNPTFPQYRNHRVNLVERLRNLDSDLNPSQEGWIQASEYLDKVGCPSLLAGLSRQHVPPHEELQQAAQLLSAFRNNNELPPLPQDLSLVLSGMLLNVIAAQAWFRGKTALAFAAYQAAQERAITDGNALVEWISILGQDLLIRNSRHIDLGPNAPEVTPEPLRQRRASLEKEKPVAALRKRTDRLQADAKSGLLEVMQLARADAMPSFWQQSWHVQIRELLEDQEELGLPPWQAGTSAELLTSAILLTPDGVSGTSLAEGIALLCRYGHSSELKGRDVGALLESRRTDHEALFSHAISPGRTTGEWFARFSITTRCLSAVPEKLIPQAEDFFVKLISHSSLFKEEIAVYFHGSSYGSVTLSSRRNAIVRDAILAASLNPNSTAFLSRCFGALTEQGQVAFLCHLHIMGDMQWFNTEQPNDPAILIELANQIHTFFTDGAGSKLLQESGNDLQPHLDLQISQIPLGLSALLDILGKVQDTEPLRNNLRQQLDRLLRVGVAKDPRRFIPSALSERVRKALREPGEETGPVFCPRFGRIAQQVLDSLETQEPSADMLDGYALLAQQREHLEPGLRQRLWDQFLEREHREQLTNRNKSVGAAPPLLWIATALLHLGDPSLRVLGVRLIERSLATPASLVALVSMPAADLDRYHGVLDSAMQACLREQADQPLPWFSPVQDPLKPHEFDSHSIAIDALHAVHNHLWFHPGRAVPKRWISLSLAHLFSSEHGCVNAALLALDAVLSQQPEVVNVDTAVTALSFILKRGNAVNRDNALRILIQYREILEADSAEAVRDAIAPYDPPRTLGELWAWQVATRSPRRA